MAPTPPLKTGCLAVRGGEYLNQINHLEIARHTAIQPLYEKGIGIGSWK
jgi:hypothetical protein